MKIRALRLAEVGPFGAPVALEGLSGALDVMTGANETGKSTLFAALGMLLAERHTSAARTVAAMRPDAGGAPLIEADFEIDGRELRLRKRFLAQRMARLEDLGSGEIWHGADAEGMADRLFGADGRSALRHLLWVAQGASFGLPEKPDAELSAGLASLIEREAADATGAGEVRRLGLEVRERLEQYVTARTGKPKTNGGYDVALRRRDELARHLGEARGKEDAATTRLARKTALVAERAASASPQAVEALGASAASARQAVANADKAREQVRAASERVAARQAVHDQARLAVERFAKLLAEAGRIAQSRADGTARLHDLVAQRAEREAHAVAAQAALDAAEALLKSARTDFDQANATALRRAALAEAAEAERRLGDARAASVAIEHAQARLSANSASEAAVEAIRRLFARLAAIDARIAAAAPRAAFAYLPAAVGRVRIDGAVVTDGQRITIDRPMQLVIEGIGTITIEPGQGVGAGAGRSATTERDETRAELAHALHLIGAADLDTAQALLASRRHDEADIAAGRARLGAAAPAGIAALEAVHRQASARAGEAPASDQAVEATPAGLALRVRDLETTVSNCRAATAAVERELKNLAGSIAGLEMQLSAELRQLVDTEAELPQPPQRDARASDLARSLDEAVSALSEAVREKTSWSDADQQGAAYDALIAAAKRAAEQQVQLAQRRASLDREIAELEGALRRDSEDGVGAEIARLEEQLVTAEARLADIQTDVAAFQTLTARLEQIGASHRDQILKPVVARLQPLLGRLFPDARLIMDEKLVVASLERADRRDPFGRVSGGTREQIATLVRVAYADLMAANGISMPLVLDDALVFSDDRRLEIMVDLLAAASQRHQVIVLSCHARALDPLMAAQSACKLALTPWLDGAADAVRPRSKPPRSRATGPASTLNQ